jgi:class 3 adenylate cyclase
MVRFDSRGNGLSDRDLPGPVDLEGLLADLEAVVDATGLERFSLWGSCFGGPTAMVFADRHPERVERLILDGTYADGGRVTTPERRDAFLTMLEAAVAHPDAVYASLSYMTDPAPAESHDERVKRARRSIDQELLVELYRLVYEIDVTSVLAGLRMPTLVVHREGSRVFPLACGRALAASIPDADFVALPGRAHNLWEERPEDGWRAVAAFLGVPLERRAGGLETSPVPVAILFTDIVGSTAVAVSLGDDRAQELVDAHDRAVQAAIEQHGGLKIKHTGDGVMARFPSVSAALRAATAIQREIADWQASGVAAPSIRIGVNAGEPLRGPEDLYGVTVNLAARACQAAGPDQVLVTQVVRDLALGKDFALAPAGHFVLKGFDEPVPLWELSWRS